MQWACLNPYFIFIFIRFWFYFLNYNQHEMPSACCFSRFRKLSFVSHNKYWTWPTDFLYLLKRVSKNAFLTFAQQVAFRTIYYLSNNIKIVFFRSKLTKRLVVTIWHWAYGNLIQHMAYGGSAAVRHSILTKTVSQSKADFPVYSIILRILVQDTSKTSRPL